ncbi:MAG: hypothetical protein KatS3mg108_0505 [Isosphaeraceae bacterium]|jgi:4-amino-4-deoxy-L-arabinose transferase-like glycosyltransferase|nr:MAG: hypothetical protein KatS3mg108_0505 [Isosphaeraceae bacterium]
MSALAATPAADSPGQHRRAVVLGLGAGLIALIVMVGTEPRLALVWDEAYTLARLDRVHAWLEAVRDPSGFAAQWDRWRLRPLEDRRRRPSAAEIDTLGELFDPQVVSWFWPFAREEPHGHPAFYALVALVGDGLMPWAGDLARARLGTMLAFSLAAGVAGWFGAKRWGWKAGLVAASAWVLHPHLFALGHYATYDGLLASLWLLGTLGFAETVEAASRRRRLAGVIGLGVVLGCAAATKLTGWLLPVPLAVWALVRRDGPALGWLLAAGLVAVPVFWAVNPPFWGEPVVGLVRFLQSNLSRSETIPIRTQFLGTIYETPTGSLPWYNTVVWVVMTTPVGFLILALGGGLAAVRQIRSEPVGLLLVLSAATLLVVRALPHTPGHDGVRQLAAALGPLAVLSGLGVASLRGRLAGWAAGLSLAEAALSVAVMMPVPLSYYSPVVGGLPGATALGMEPTYYWDALTPEAFRRLDERVEPGRSVLFVANPVAWYYNEAGLLRAPVYMGRGEPPAVAVVQNRPGSMAPAVRELVRRQGNREGTVLVRVLGVPLIWAFPADEGSGL